MARSGYLDLIEPFDWRLFDASALARAKGDRQISVCIPACDEEETVARVVRAVRADLMDRVPLVDELLVVDDGSGDATAAEAERAGAEVLSLGRNLGKGRAMSEGLYATTGDVVAFCDADVTNFHSGFVLGLVGPLLFDPGLALVKGAYSRPLGGRAGEGGRVTELVAKPLLGMYFPELRRLRQPLAGEWAGRRDALEAVTFADGYAVEIAVLIDVAARYGAAAVAECDLGTREHRNRPLAQLVPQSEGIMRHVLTRAGVRID